MLEVKLGFIHAIFVCLFRILEVHIFSHLSTVTLKSGFYILHSKALGLLCSRISDFYLLSFLHCWTPVEGNIVSNSWFSHFTLKYLILFSCFQENDEFFELVSSKFLSDTRYTIGVHAAAARLLLACPSTSMVSMVFFLLFWWINKQCRTSTSDTGDLISFWTHFISTFRFNQFV